MRKGGFKVLEGVKLHNWPLGNFKILTFISNEIQSQIRNTSDGG